MLYDPPPTNGRHNTCRAKSKPEPTPPKHDETEKQTTDLAGPRPGHAVGPELAEEVHGAGDRRRLLTGGLHASLPISCRGQRKRRQQWNGPRGGKRRLDSGKGMGVRAVGLWPLAQPKDSSGYQIGRHSSISLSLCSRGSDALCAVTVVMSTKNIPLW